MALSSLSLEIWLGLAARLSFPDFWALLACGDQILIRKLRSSAILTSLNINLVNTKAFTSAVKHINLGKLKTLSVEASAHEVLSQPSLVARMPFLTRFDWTVERINGKSMWEMLLKPNTTNYQDIDIASTMPSLEHFGFYFLQATAYRNMERTKFILPESLTSLILEWSVSRVDMHSPIFNMPPNLTRLYCHGVSLLSTHNLTTVLPRSLTALGASVPVRDDAQPHDDWKGRWRRVAEDIHPDPTLEMRVSEWLSCERLRDLVNCEDPVWSEYIPPERESYLEELMMFHKNRYTGWGALRFLPNLVEISVSAYRGDDDESIDEVPIDPIYLPPTITSLETRHRVYIGSRTLWWPPNITSFNSGEYSVPLGSILDRKDVPCQLTLLADSDALFESLPPHKFNPTSASKHYLDAKLTASLPHHLVKMSIWTEYKLKCIGLLPKTLTFLELKAHRMAYTVLNSDVLELTKSYSGLVLRESGIPLSQINDPALNSIYDVNFSSDASASTLPPFWPPGLTYLKLAQASPLLLDILPKSITHYDFECVGVSDGFFKRVGDTLPWLLRSISEDDLIHAVKRYYDTREGRHIANVILRISAAACLPHFYAHAERITLDCFADVRASDFAGFTKLRKLKTVACFSIENATSLFDYLPPTIESVDIDCREEQIDDSILLKVPEGIHKLRLRYLPMSLATVATSFASGAYGDELNEATLEAGYVDIIDSFYGRVLVKETPLNLFATPSSSLLFPTTIASIDLITDIGDPIFYSILPASLTNLRIVKALAVSDEALSSLPSALLHLEFCEDNSLTGEFISDLPMLLTLKLPRNGKITSAALARLPSTLETLNLHVSTYINDLAIEYLPPSITDLDISWAMLSCAAFMLLPRGLTALDIENCESLDTADVADLPPSLTSLRAPYTLLKHCTPDILPLLVITEKSKGQSMGGLFDDF